MAYTIACPTCGIRYDDEREPTRCGACGTPGPRVIPCDPVPMFPGTNRGPAVLSWLLATDATAIGCLTDRDLHGADAAAIVAVAPRHCHPAALEAVSRVRTRIARILASRAHDRARAATPDTAAAAAAPAPVPPAQSRLTRALEVIAPAVYEAIRDDAPPDDDDSGGRPVRRPVPPPHDPPPAGRLPAPLAPVPVRRAAQDDGF